MNARRQSSSSSPAFGEFINGEFIIYLFIFCTFKNESILKRIFFRNRHNEVTRIHIRISTLNRPPVLGICCCHNSKRNCLFTMAHIICTCIRLHMCNMEKDERAQSVRRVEPLYGAKLSEEHQKGSRPLNFMRDAESKSAIYFDSTTYFSYCFLHIFQLIFWFC